MFCTFATLLMSHMSFIMLMQQHLALYCLTEVFCVFLYNFITDCESLVLYLVTVCTLCELKLLTLVLNRVYCIAWRSAENLHIVNDCT